MLPSILEAMPEHPPALAFELTVLPLVAWAVVPTGGVEYVPPLSFRSWSQIRRCAELLGSTFRRDLYAYRLSGIDSATKR